MKISEEKLKKAMERARHSLVLEGFEVTEEHDDLVLKSIRGEISQSEFIQLAKAAALQKGRDAQ